MIGIIVTLIKPICLWYVFIFVFFLGGGVMWLDFVLFCFVFGGGYFYSFEIYFEK